MDKDLIKKIASDWIIANRAKKGLSDGEVSTVKDFATFLDKFLWEGEQERQNEK